MKGAILNNIIYLVCVTILYVPCNVYSFDCPELCTCQKIKKNDEDINELRIKCGGNPSQKKITNIKEIDFGELRNEIVSLNLSQNQISVIEPNDFYNMTNLRKLDLSHNSLKQIDDTVFGQLKSLDKLRLQHNLIIHIFQGSFDGMPVLKQLDISSNLLACDCDLLWLIPWANKAEVKLQSNPKCQTPAAFKNMTLKKLKIGSDLHCESKRQPLLELRPFNDQLVFEGDSLTLQCRAPRVAVSDPRDSEDLPNKPHVFWGWSETIMEPDSLQDITFHDPRTKFPSIQIEDRHLSDHGLLDSTLHIPNVTRNHSGMWDCRLSSHQANLSKNVAVVVVSDKTKYCPALETFNNKGSYSWPQTIRGNKVILSCTIGKMLASHKCNENGFWEELDTSACPFIKDTTRSLEEFYKMNLSMSRVIVLDSAKRLRSYTAIEDELNKQTIKFRDPIDVVFIAKTLTNYLEYVLQENELGTMLLDIVSQVMYLPSPLLQRAQEIDGSCNKLVAVAEKSAAYTLSMQTVKTNLALEMFKFRVDTFLGITCTWFRSEVNLNDRIFQCNAANKAQGLGIHEKYIEASIQFPSTLFSQVSSQKTTIQELLVSVFQNGNFFPQNKNVSSLKVTSSIIGGKLSNKLTVNLTDPIFVMLRPAPFHHELSSPRPVWWDPDMNSGIGGWSVQGCNLSHLLHGMLVFTCYKVGYYGLMQHVKYLNDFTDEHAGARFRLSPPAFYIGGLVLFICMFINITTYLVYGGSIQMARRTKHSLVNTWLAIAMLSFIFTVGIYQSEDYRLCQIIGIIIHYLSLSVLLWICVNVCHMYKRISKQNRNSVSLPSDDLPKENVGRKPILGLYLVGWGISFIVCGISAAVNIREYASYSHCFMQSGPALSAIFVPAGILIFFLMILFTCIKCNINGTDINGHMSEGTQATENVDLDLLEPNLPNNQNPRCQSMSISTPTSSSHICDQEHSHCTQLKAHIIVLFWYAVTWMAAAISVSTPFAESILYQEEIFSIIYAVSATILGLFAVFFYGVARSDVRFQWSLLSCHNIFYNRRKCCRSRSISDSKELNSGPSVTYHQAPAVSRSNSQSSKSCRPISNANILKSAADLNSHTLNHSESPTGHKISGANMSLVLLHRQQFVHNPVVLHDTQTNSMADIFYNPNQSNVARKFFRKQKRLAKQNNIEIQRHRSEYIGDNGSDISSNIMTVYPPLHNKGNDMSMYCSGSKVNNTNIHIDKKNIIENSFSKEARQQHINPNILSDSCTENDLICVDAERLVLGAEGLRKLAQRSKINNTDNALTGNNIGQQQQQHQQQSMIANIYTNVPETLLPQHEVVTMRADDKFKKLSNVEEEDNEYSDGEKSHPLLNGQEIKNKKDVPHYVNENFKINNNVNKIPEPTFLELRTGTNSEALILSLNSPILAMNTVGLPILSSPLSISTISPTDLKCIEDDNDLDDDDEVLLLSKEKEYISSPMEISNVSYHNNNDIDNDNEVLSINKNRAKSLDNINTQSRQNLIQCDNNRQTIAPGTSTSIEIPPMSTRSISFNNIICLDETGITDNINNYHTHNRTNKSLSSSLSSPHILTSSPILFSPSLCDINDDMPSPSISNNIINIENNTHGDDNNRNNLQYSYFNDNNHQIATPISFNNVTTQQLLRNNYTSSPTSESDINYQNSEISIRSHGLYAPQPDQDLNITLTADDNINYPYQSSELSDLDDDEDDDDDEDEIYNCSQDLLLLNPQDDSGAVGVTIPMNDEQLNESQSSIDELYQQITRRHNSYHHNGNTDLDDINIKLSPLIDNQSSPIRRNYNLNESQPSQSLVSLPHHQQSPMNTTYLIKHNNDNDNDEDDDSQCNSNVLPSYKDIEQKRNNQQESPNNKLPTDCKNIVDNHDT